MEWLNYHHLHYFWTVAREGSVSRAGKLLYVTQPTVSAQLRALESALGEKLFVKAGRGLVLSDVGQVVYRYADEIFSLGKELIDTVRGHPAGRPRKLVVGVADVLPKLVVHRLLEPALRMPEPIQIVCHEETPENLLAELSIRGLDVVLSDAPVPPDVRIRAFSHLLGESSVSVFGPAARAIAYRRSFPRSLDGAPFLLPTANTALRRSIDQWFDAHGIRPLVRGEFEDSALLEVFGREGCGLFAAPTILDAQVRRRYGVRMLGRIPSIRMRFYAISIEKKLKHPAVVAITATARRELFA
ncbi:MAG TPA: transcriptional activator NhaR [Planctomycetes bacterium]|nr:transcriptional activator NhaR [Planctomycetota bacterium]